MECNHTVAGQVSEGLRFGLLVVVLDYLGSFLVNDYLVIQTGIEEHLLEKSRTKKQKTFSLKCRISDSRLHSFIVTVVKRLINNVTFKETL